MYLIVHINNFIILLTKSSSMDQNLWNWSIFSYHSATGTIPSSGWLPTIWSINNSLPGGLQHDWIVEKCIEFNNTYNWDNSESEYNGSLYPGRNLPVKLVLSTNVWVVSPYYIMINIVKHFDNWLVKCTYWDHHIGVCIV